MIFFRLLGQLAVHGFSAFLVLTQMFMPLIHGHGGYDEPASGIHMPGLENIQRAFDHLHIRSTHGFQYSGREFIIGVACGVKPNAQIAPVFDCTDEPAVVSEYPFLAGGLSDSSFAQRNDYLPDHIVRSNFFARAPPLA
jgi:hypothetical protein